MSGMQPGRWLIAVAVVVVSGTVVAAVLVMGTPDTQRELRIDARRVADLASIENAIEVHYRTHGELPEDLATLTTKPGVRLNVADPANNQPYGYRIEGQRVYRLCADFSSDTAAQGTDWPPAMWAHGTGPTCFQRKVRFE